MSKASKKRACPVVGQAITNAECGENRGSKYACPADCQHSLLASANYSHLLELEEAVDRASMERLKHDSPDVAALTRDIDRAARSHCPHALHALIVWRLFQEKDANGRTTAERWEQAGLPGLKNDGRVLFRAKMRSRVVLIEVRRVIDAEQVEVVDLLESEPRPMVVRDRGLASSAARFSCGLTWCYALPHYHRMTGSATMVQEVGSHDPRVVVEEIVRHLGGSTEEASMRRWLAEHYVRFSDSLMATALERQRMMLAGIDAKFGKVVYELKRPYAECCAMLDAEANVDTDNLEEGERREGFADARIWLENGQAAEGRAQQLLGRILLGQSHWRIKAMGAEKTAELRKRFEQLLGDRVRFQGERLDDLAKSMAEKQPQFDLALVPPRLLENPTSLKLSSSRVRKSNEAATPEEAELAVGREFNLQFLDAQVPALDNLTPRQAAKDPKLRPTLISLMKARVRQCDERNLETGDSEDINWMLRDLGLDEIIFDPPPPGRVSRLFRPGSTGTDEDAHLLTTEELAEETVVQAMDDSLPPVPPLSHRPFTNANVTSAIERIFQMYEEAEDAEKAMRESGCTLIDDVYEVTEGLVEADHFPLLVTPLIHSWFMFVPHGTRGFNLPRTVIRKAILRDAAQMSKALDTRSKAAFDDYLNSGPQPKLAQMMMGELFESSRALPLKLAPSVEKLGVMAAVVRGIIEELDKAHRRR